MIKIHDQRHYDALIYAMQKIADSPLSEYVRELYLYGSCSRGDHNWGSDVDLLLSLDEDSSHMRREIRLLKSDVTSDDPRAACVDLKVVFGDAWKENKMTYYQNIKKEGVRLWGSD